MRKLTWTQVAAWRSQRHYLTERAPGRKLLAVASRLCGLHAQLMSSAELMAWARVKDLDRQAVQRSLWEERTLVKTWAMRGTLHLLPAADLPMWHAVLGTSPRFLRPAVWLKYFGLTIEELDRLTAAVGTVLTGRTMTREELAREVERISGSKASGTKLWMSSWGTILRPAAFSGYLCFAPSVGQRVQFTHPKTWLNAAPKRIEPQTAQAEVTRRFLGAYGPATYHDLARWWNGGGVATAKQWIASLGEEVSAVEIEGAPAWMLAADARSASELAPQRFVRLLPAFDQYVVGASYHVERLVRGGSRSQVFRPQGWISPVLLVNSRMEGIWRHEIKSSRVEVTIEPFVKQPLWARRAAGEEAERLAWFLGGALHLTWKN
jgi:DNA glycosylase AlkZ-like